MALALGASVGEKSGEKGLNTNGARPEGQLRKPPGVYRDGVQMALTLRGNCRSRLVSRCGIQIALMQRGSVGNPAGV